MLQLPLVRTTVFSRAVPVRCAAPPPLSTGEGFACGELSSGNAWWRQDAECFQLVALMPEDASFKRDVDIEVRQRSISLSVSGNSVIDGTLCQDVLLDDCDWFVDDELQVTCGMCLEHLLYLSGHQQEIALSTP